MGRGGSSRELVAVGARMLWAYGKGNNGSSKGLAVSTTKWPAISRYFTQSRPKECGKGFR